MANLQKLRAELDAGHPVTGAYSEDPQIASDQINALNRSRINPVNSAELLAWSGQSSVGIVRELSKLTKENQTRTKIALRCVSQQMK